MQEKLQIAIVQADLVWQNAQKNRVRFSEKIAEIQEPVDLIVLPEMFTTGFSMEPALLAETMKGTTVVWMQEKAKEKNAAIIGSLIIQEENNFYNRILFVHPTGDIETYDKRHLFTLAGEDKVYTKGNSLKIIPYKGWKICPLICYDLRFPVWSRNVAQYDILIYVASWPTPRIHAWNTLLKARAIENISYCIGVNRVGVDFNEHHYSGNSTAIDFLGNELTPICEYKEAVLVATFQKSLLNKTRNNLNFLKDKDVFEIL